MEHAQVQEIAWALTRTGHPTLRFNYRGVGASAGRFDVATMVDDLMRAYAHLVASAALPLADRAGDVRPIPSSAGTSGARPGRHSCTVAGVRIGHGADLLWKTTSSRAALFGRLVLVAPLVAPDGQVEADAPPPSVDLTVAVPAGSEPSAIARMKVLADRAPCGRWMSIDGADLAFRRGLVALGRAVTHVLACPE